MTNNIITVPCIVQPFKIVIMETVLQKKPILLTKCYVENRIENYIHVMAIATPGIYV